MMPLVSPIALDSSISLLNNDKEQQVAIAADDGVSNPEDTPATQSQAATTPTPAPADTKQLQQRMKVLLREKGNKTCSECRSHKPKWISLLQTPIDADRSMLGVFVCSTCYQYHLDLGQELCQLKSLKEPETWTEEDVETLEKSGNSAVNAIYQSELEGNHTDKHIGSLASSAFVKSKYQDCHFFTQEAYHQQMALRAAGKETTDAPPEPTTEELVRRALGKQRNEQGSSMRNLLSKSNSLKRLEDSAGNLAGSSSDMLNWASSSGNVSFVQEADNSKNLSSIKSLDFDSSHDLQQQQQQTLSLRERRQQRKSRRFVQTQTLLDEELELTTSYHGDDVTPTTTKQHTPKREDDNNRTQRAAARMRKAVSQRDMQTGTRGRPSMLRASSQVDVMQPAGAGRRSTMKKSLSSKDVTSRSGRRSMMQTSLSNKDFTSKTAAANKRMNMHKSLSTREFTPGGSTSTRLSMYKSLSSKELVGATKPRRATARQRLAAAESASTRNLRSGGGGRERANSDGELSLQQRESSSVRKGPKSSHSPPQQRRNPRTDSNSSINNLNDPITSESRRVSRRTSTAQRKEAQSSGGGDRRQQSSANMRNSRSHSSDELRGSKTSKPNQASKSRSSEELRGSTSSVSSSSYNISKPSIASRSRSHEELRGSASSVSSSNSNGKSMRSSASQRGSRTGSYNSLRSLSPSTTTTGSIKKTSSRSSVRRHPRTSNGPRSLSPCADANRKRSSSGAARRSSLSMVVAEEFDGGAIDPMPPQRPVMAKKPSHRFLLEESLSDAEDDDEEVELKPASTDRKPKATLSADAAVEKAQQRTSGTTTSKSRRKTRRGSVGGGASEEAKTRRTSSRRSQPLKALSVPSGLGSKHQRQLKTASPSKEELPVEPQRSSSDSLLPDFEDDESAADGSNHAEGQPLGRESGVDLNCEQWSASTQEECKLADGPTGEIPQGTLGDSVGSLSTPAAA